MANTTPIRILIAGGSSNDREQVGSFLRAHSFSVAEAPEPGASDPPAADDAVMADAVVMIEPVSQPQSTAEILEEVVPARAPVVLLTKEPTLAEKASAQIISMSKLPVLPGLISDVVERQRGSVRSDAHTALRAMRESQRLIAVGRLLAEIVHEINNPLESVGNLIYLALHEQNLPERAADFLHSAERELQRVVQISKQTLSFSRESSEPIPIQISELMDEVISMYSRRIENKKLSLTREYAAVESVLVFPGEIRQVLSNLVTNAIEASSEGGKLRLRIREVVQHRGNSERRGVRVTIADSGTGIPESARKRLGQIFFTTKGETGTGLGLWVTNAIVARYGGTMRLRSSTGKRHGTIFTVFLPPASATVIGSPDEEGDTMPPTGNVTEISRHPRHATHDHHSIGRHMAVDEGCLEQRKQREA